MTKDQKAVALDELKEKFESHSFFYLTDFTAMTVKQTNVLRRECFEKGITMKVVKNALAVKAMKDASADKNYEQLFNSFKGQTAILFTDQANLPARMLKDLRLKGIEKPFIKAAYIDSAIFVGDDQIDTLATLKSKEELLGEILGLLQSPAKNVISALLSGGQKIAGILKTLEEKEG
jgi:large subunit ribosomal protein L10